MTAKKPEHLLQKRRRMVTADTKQCKECGIVKNVVEFQMLRHNDRPGKPHYWTSRCKPCAAEHNRIRLYGVTLAEMMAKQGSSLCPLCQKRPSACLDHNHKTGEPRGALCQPCNRALHYVESEEWMNRAEVYLASEK